jgi:hypothetical protein
VLFDIVLKEVRKKIEVNYYDTIKFNYTMYIFLLRFFYYQIRTRNIYVEVRCIITSILIGAYVADRKKQMTKKKYLLLQS